MSEPLIDTEVAERVLTAALANGGDFAEVFAERSAGLTMAIDESRVEAVQAGASAGAGVRVISGATTYFSHVDGLDPADIERAAGEAAAALRAERTEPRPLSATRTTPLPIEVAPAEVPVERKADLLRELDQRGRGVEYLACRWLAGDRGIAADPDHHGAKQFTQRRIARVSRLVRNRRFRGIQVGRQRLRHAQQQHEGSQKKDYQALDFQHGAQCTSDSSRGGCPPGPRSLHAPSRCLPARTR